MPPCEAIWPPRFEESQPFLKGSQPTTHHGCWANLLIEKDQVTGVEFATVPSLLSLSVLSSPFLTATPSKSCTTTAPNVSASTASTVLKRDNLTGNERSKPRQNLSLVRKSRSKRSARTSTGAQLPMCCCRMERTSIRY